MRVIKWVVDQIVELIENELIKKRAEPKYLIDISGFKAVTLGDSTFTKEKTDSAATFIAGLKKAVSEDSKVGKETAVIKSLSDLVRAEKTKIASIEKQYKSAAGMFGLTNYESGTYDGLLTACSQVLEDLNNLIKEIPKIVQYTSFEVKKPLNLSDPRIFSLKRVKSEFFWSLTQEFIQMRFDFHCSTATRSRLDLKYARLYNNEQIIQVCDAIKRALKVFEEGFPKKVEHIPLIIDGVLLAIERCNHTDPSRKLGVLVASLEREKGILSNPWSGCGSVSLEDFEENTIAEGNAIGGKATAAATATTTVAAAAATTVVATATASTASDTIAAAVNPMAANAQPMQGAELKGNQEALRQQVNSLQAQLRALNAKFDRAATSHLQMPPLLQSMASNTAVATVLGNGSAANSPVAIPAADAVAAVAEAATVDAVGAVGKGSHAKKKKKT